MLTPAKPSLWEGSSAAGVHEEEPRVHVSVEEVSSLHPVLPPETMKTCTQIVTYFDTLV